MITTLVAVSARSVDPGSRRCHLAKRERSTPRDQERRMEESSTWRSRYQNSRCWSQFDVSSISASLLRRHRRRELTLSLKDNDNISGYNLIGKIH